VYNPELNNLLTDIINFLNLTKYTLKEMRELFEE